MRFKEILLEYKRDITAKRFHTQIYDRLTKYGDNVAKSVLRTAAKAKFGDPELKNLPDGFVDNVILNFIEDQMDPTQNNQYTVWILKQWLAVKLRFEDYGRVNLALTTFEKIKPQLKKDGIDRDINNYNWSSLQDLVEKYHEEVSGKESKREELERAKTESKILYDGPDGKLVVPKTEFASCFWGRGTRWCTAATESQNYFDDYNSLGKLYIWIDNEYGKFQFHVDGELGELQFMDAKDEQIDDGMFRILLERGPLKQIFAEKIEPIIFNVSTDYTILEYFDLSLVDKNGRIDHNILKRWLYWGLSIIKRFPIMVIEVLKRYEHRFIPEDLKTDEMKSLIKIFKEKFPNSTYSKFYPEYNITEFDNLIYRIENKI